MSWDSDHVRGYGLALDTVKAGPVITFCRNHSEAFAKYIYADDLTRVFEEIEQTRAEDGAYDTADPEEHQPHSEYYAYDIDLIREQCNDGTVADVVACIIREETGVSFYSYGPADYSRCEEQQDVVLFTAEYPWEMTEADKCLKSEQDVFNVLKPYAEELEIPDMTGHYDLVYSG